MLTQEFNAHLLRAEALGCRQVWENNDVSSDT